jgi:hypothetical protein
MVYSTGGRASEERRCTDVRGWTLLQLSFKEHVSSRKLLICEEIFTEVVAANWTDGVSCANVTFVLAAGSTYSNMQHNAEVQACPYMSATRNHHAQPSRWGAEPGVHVCTRTRPGGVLPSNTAFEDDPRNGTGTSARHGLTVNVPAGCGMSPPRDAAEGNDNTAWSVTRSCTVRR